MNLILKNTLAVIAGLIMGSAINIGLIMICNSIIPPPDGTEAMTIEELKKSVHLFEPKHYIFPFLSNAIGSFIGAFVASLIASKHKIMIALTTGVFFMIGGITNSLMISTPTWFLIIDLVAAYIPMSFLGYRLARKFKLVKKENKTPK